MNKAVIITSGDPAGIGPEVILRLAVAEAFALAPSVIIGRRSLYEKLASDMGIKLETNPVDESLKLKSGVLN
ncbi:MAG: 4-hydroxythreonine-4-phosphate dehydrogenase, partial [Elusimicrobia bacterium CG_4_8_14_3_um_filter_50_9]